MVHFEKKAGAWLRKKRRVKQQKRLEIFKI